MKEKIKEKYCICATCGTMYSDHETSFCINGHDDWLEIDDGVENFERASKNTGISVAELISKIKRK